MSAVSLEAWCLPYSPRANFLVGMQLTAQPAGGWDGHLHRTLPNMYSLSLGVLRAQRLGGLAQCSVPPESQIQPNLHNPLSFIIMVLPLAGNLCRQDKDHRVDLGNKKSSFRWWTAVSKVTFPSQTHILNHVWRRG